MQCHNAFVLLLSFLTLRLDGLTFTWWGCCRAELANGFLLCFCVCFCFYKLRFISHILPTTLRFLTVFFRSYFCFSGPFNDISLYESLLQPWSNSFGWLGLKHRRTNFLTLLLWHVHMHFRQRKPRDSLSRLVSAQNGSVKIENFSMSLKLHRACQEVNLLWMYLAVWECNSVASEFYAAPVNKNVNQFLVVLLVQSPRTQQHGRFWHMWNVFSCVMWSKTFLAPKITALTWFRCRNTSSAEVWNFYGYQKICV